MLEVGNNTETQLIASQAIPFTLVSYDTNLDSHFDSTKNALMIDRSGYYIISGNFTFAPTEEGDVSISLYVEGSEIPVSTATFTAGANEKYNFVISPKVIKTIPTFTDTSVPVTFIVSTAGTLYNANALLIGAR